MRWIFCFPGSSTLACTATPLPSPGMVLASLLSAGVDAPDPEADDADDGAGDERRYQTRRRRLVAGLFGVPPESSVPRPLTRLLGFLELFCGNMNRCSCSISAWMRRDPTSGGVPEPRLWSMRCRSESAAPLAPPQLRLPGGGPNGASLW